MRMVTGLIAKRNSRQIPARPSATIASAHSLRCPVLLQGRLRRYTHRLRPGACGRPARGRAQRSLLPTRRHGRVTAGQFGYLADGNTLPEVVPAERGIRVTMPSSIAANKGGDGIGGAGALECAVQ
jgi:hypothetical protein